VSVRRSINVIAVDNGSDVIVSEAKNLPCGEILRRSFGATQDDGKWLRMLSL
jgi:hypothetical protein